jgi:hypothetical protein
MVRLTSSQVKELNKRLQKIINTEPHTDHEGLELDRQKDYILKVLKQGHA